MKNVNRIFYAAFFTASCDVVLNLNVGGSLRFAQLMLCLVLLAAVARIVQDGRLLWPDGFTALAVWVLWQGCCIPLSGVISLGLEFYVLLLFTVLSALGAVQLWGLDDSIEPLMKAYLASFITIAGWGAFQFLLPLLFHIPAPFTQQWLQHNRVARINGFSYEPSYFATYLFIGWVTLVDLRYSKAEIASSPRMKQLTYLVGAVLFFSSSKTAWLAMALEGIFRLGPGVWAVVRRALNSLSDGKLLVPSPDRRERRNIILGALFMVFVVVGVNQLGIGRTTLLSGTGLGGSAAHSLNDRSGSAALTWQAFKQSPWMGRSLGGVAVAVASSVGVEVTNLEAARSYLGFPVILDVLVASGIFGFIPFLVFLYQTTFGAMRTATLYFPDERAKWLRALGRAMLLEWFLLLSDQNLFRIYLWLHFSMILVVSFHLQYGPSLASIRARKQMAAGESPTTFSGSEAPAV